MTPSRATKRQRTASSSSDSSSIPLALPQLPTASSSDIADDEDCASSWGGSSPLRQASVSQENSDLLDRATHILATEAAALVSVSQLYKTDPTARAEFAAAVTAAVSAQHAGGKLLFCGVGKSAYIAQKLTATCKSLSVRASYMHACEAVHGDLGDIQRNDIIVFVSYSGRTPELLNLLPHIPMSTPVMSISSQRTADQCALLADRQPCGILLSAPIPESEESTFGVSAPTTSTTVALALGDMLALTVANELHQDGNTGALFRRNHPGGAIGITTAQLAAKTSAGRPPIAEHELPTPCMSEGDT